MKKPIICKIVDSVHFYANNNFGDGPFRNYLTVSHLTHTGILHTYFLTLYNVVPKAFYLFLKMRFQKGKGPGNEVELFKLIIT